MKNVSEFNPSPNTIAKLIPVGIIIFILFLAAQTAFVAVDTGHVGVVRTFGAVNPVGLPEGFHFKKPFIDQVELMDIRLNSVNAKSSAASKDLQTVSTEITTTFSITASMAPQVYQKIGQAEKVSVVLVSPAIQESVKSVTAKFTAEQLVTQRQAVKTEIQQAILAFINWTLKEKQLEGALQIANVAITDFSFSDEFNRAIELKVKAEQEALQAINEKTKRVTQAEAAAAERQLAATAEAFQIDAESKARADAIRREADALRGNPELIKLRTIEKWDGTLPRMTGSEAVPFINMDDLNKSATPTR